MNLLQNELFALLTLIQALRRLIGSTDLTPKQCYARHSVK